MAASGCRKIFSSRPGNRFGQIEQRMIFSLAEILRLKKFGQADDFRAPSRCVGDPARAFSRFFSGSGPHDICTRATRNFSGGTRDDLREQI